MVRRPFGRRTTDKRYCAPAAPFARKYTPIDIGLLAEMDKANEDVCGPAIAHLLQRAYSVYGDTRYERLAGNQCRKRTTSVSVRFLGRRVYLGLAVALMSAGRLEATAAVAGLGEIMEIPVRTVQRWRNWWVEQFPLTPLWQATCVRFIPPVALSQLPVSLIERFAGSAAELLM